MKSHSMFTVLIFLLSQVLLHSYSRLADKLHKKSVLCLQNKSFGENKLCESLMSKVQNMAQNEGFEVYFLPSEGTKTQLTQKELNDLKLAQLNGQNFVIPEILKTVVPDYYLLIDLNKDYGCSNGTVYCEVYEGFSKKEICDYKKLLLNLMITFQIYDLKKQMLIASFQEYKSYYFNVFKNQDFKKDYRLNHIIPSYERYYLDDKIYSEMVNNISKTHNSAEAVKIVWDVFNLYFQSEVHKSILETCDHVIQKFVERLKPGFFQRFD